MQFPIILPELDPVAIAFGPIVIRWYSLAYIAGILSMMLWIKKCNQDSIKNNEGPILSAVAYENWMIWAILSIMLGGRLGYVLFYNLPYFLSHPLEIFAFWQGGMSFHGGLIGSIIGSWLFAKRYKINFLRLTDIFVVAAPIGLFFGRLANFINMELYGRVTESNFGIVFPNAGNLPRHPSQLYEALLEGLLMFIILFSLHQFSSLPKRRGFLSGMFLILYGTFRLLVENFREPDEQIGFIFLKITMGQILSLPIILGGIYVIFFLKKHEKNELKI